MEYLKVTNKSCYMKKALFSLVFVGIIASFSGHSYAAVSCTGGDKFDIFTGKPCVIVAIPVIDKDAQIAALQAQVASLQAQIASFKNGAITSMVSNKEEKLREIDSQILPLLNNINTSDRDTYTKQVNSILVLYKIADPSSNFPNISKAESYAAFDLKVESLRELVENYIKYRTF